jgi:predicted butyrate kinase (DUF1464 family)
MVYNKAVLFRELMALFRQNRTAAGFFIPGRVLLPLFLFRDLRGISFETSFFG